MFFNADDDENDFMSTGGGSKLANLFGMDKASRQGGNESLTYTAPKQPRKKESTPDGGAAPVVVVASVVHAYKYVDGKYAPQGKLGAALLANHGAKDYRILLYVTQQKQITNAKISLTFAFNVQQNNYASFYDDTRQMWSIMFESVDAAEKFAKEVAVAKANSVSGTLTDLIQQDLLLGEGGLLESGDSAEVKYIGWLLTNGALGKVFDQSQQDNYFRFRVGKGKVIKGWDQGMLGMKKGAKRILIIPPSLAYGSQGAGERVPPDSTLVFEVQVMRVKLQKGDSPQPSPAPTPAPVAMPALPNDNDDLEDLGVKGRTKSINEHLTQSPDSNKAKLISRMARMGQPMLPLQGAIPAQPDESDEEMHPHIETPPAAVKPSLAAKPRSMSGVGVGMAPTSAQVIVNQAQPTVLQSMGNPPMMMTMDGLLHQPQPDFLQNLPGAQQLAVYQNPNTFLQQQQQQQAALIQQQQQQLLQQQQQLLGHGLIGGVQGPGGPFAVSSHMPSPLQPAHSQPAHSQPPAQPSQPDSLAPALLSETRQQNTEIRINLSKMSDKVDKILEKLDHMSNTSMMGQMNQNMHMMGSLTPYGSSMTAPSMEASVLMQNITRIVQENERLKKDLYDQSNKVQEQNEKIAKLLEQNQRYVEQSHNMLEQRNEGYKTTASQSQAKVLSLEQEKVHLATELSSASAQISTLQLELAEYRKREGELKQQIQLSTNFNLTSKEELDQLRLQREEDEQKVAVLTASIREEKQARKASDAKLTSITEELNDLRASHVTLEKNLTERKRKALEDRRKLEEDMEEAKQNYEHTIESLREKLRKQKTSVDAETDFKVSKIEEDLTRELQAKYDRNMAVVTEKHNRQIEDLKSEKDELLRKIDEQEKKIASIRSSGTSTEKQVQILQDELADMKVWKEKYDSLRNQAAAMKDKYEKRLEEMEGEMEQEEEKRNEIVEKAKEQRQDLLQQIQQLQQQLQQMRKQLQAASESAHQRNLESSAPSADVTQEVKKIMNTVFQTLRAEFDSEENYSGDEVLSTILNVIKQTTLKLVNQSAPKQEESEGENEEESEKEEEDEQEDKKKKKEEGVDEVDDEDEEPISAVSLPQVSTEPTKPLNLSVSEQTSEKSSIPETQAEEEEVETSPETPANNTEISAKVEESPLHPETKDEFQTGVAYKSEGENNSAEANTKHIFAEDEKAAFERDNDAGATSPQLDEDADEQFENALDDIPSSDTPVAAAPLEGAKTSNGLDSGDLSSEKSESESSTQQGKIENTKEEISEELKKLNLAASTVVAPKARTDVIDQPPPLFDDDEDEDSPLFGNDDTVSDTLGAEFTPKARSASSNNNVPVNDPAKNKTTSGKKEQANEEDLKPQPPPPLFGDDSDDDDLDWLS